MTETVETRGGFGSLLSTAEVEPFEYYDRVREAGGIVWDEDLKAWVVASYGLIREIGQNDQQLWEGQWVHKVEEPPFGFDYEEWLDYMGYGSRRIPQVTDGQEHDHLHRRWMRVFSGRGEQLARLGDTYVRPAANAQLDLLLGRGTAELDEEFSKRVAPRAITAALGLPWHDDEWIARLLQLSAERTALLFSRMALRASDELTDEQRVVLERGLAAPRLMAEHVRPSVEARKTDRRDDLISAVWNEAPEFFGPGYSETDVIAVILAAFTASSNSAAAATSNGLYLLLSNPGLDEQLRLGGSHAVARFVEETLRLYGPGVHRPRFAKVDLTLGGAQIKKGDMVIAVYLAGNHDESHHSCPAQLDLERSAARDHFSLGLQGPRACPGQGLGRIVLGTVLSVVVERLSGMELDSVAEPPRYRDFYQRRWAPLHVRLDRVRQP